MGWPVVELGEVSELITKGTTPTSLGFKFTESGVNFIKVESISLDGEFIPEKFSAVSEECNRALGRSQLRSGDVLFSIAGALGRTALVTDEVLPANTNQALALIRIKKDVEIDKNYLLYALKTGLTMEQVEKHKGGVAQQNLSLTQLKSFQISTPPIPEQKRIVAILDKAFADIDRVRELTERNLQNARELFDSYLQQVFSQRGDGWLEERIGEIAEIQYGFTDKAQPEGDYRYVRITDINKNGLLTTENKKYIRKSKEASHFIANDSDLLMARTGATFAKVLLFENIEPSVFASYLIRIDFKGRVENRFYWYFSKSRSYWRQAESLRSGAAQPHFNGAALKQLLFFYPKSLSEQKMFVKRFDELSTQLTRLELLYTNKVNSLEDLKKSLLQKAFSGELTKTTSSELGNVIPFPCSISNISATDLHIGILAMAYQAHQDNDNIKYFGHVKAEKIAHMVEAMVGVDLGRNPIQDAAGPNDFGHLRRIEYRAKRANFFTFEGSSKTGYKLIKGGRFDVVKQKANTALADSGYLEPVEKLIQLMLPMNTKQAEIFATVYAAWNNLLLDKSEVTDELIVLAARENWHESKLKISRDLFFEEIDRMRKENLEPLGKGKYVQ